MTTSPTDCARVTAFVAVEPAAAFAIFTEEIDVWWRRGPRFRTGESALRLEPGAGGRLVETGGGRATELGRVRVWEPGARLVLEWGRGLGDGESTEVEVRFEAAAGGTRVVIEHRGWDAIGPDHPIRHGLEGSAFTDMIGLWWADIATGLRAHAARRR